MTDTGITVEQGARWFLEQLRTARRMTGDSRFGHARMAIEALVRLHELTEDGGLPQAVDGRDFKSEAAVLLNSIREVAGLEAALIAGRIEDARFGEMELALTRRSALQYLADDFRGTVADGLVDDELFDEDDELADKLREDDPLPPSAVPRHVPPSHWWWGIATRAAGR